ncbi:unnamed protein product [Gongylonema pulchrum]|uniref:Cuticlin C-terminal domain-containing protein n=1 Tax=Gongylonema pulchrum TaxID=637853 RepID=A0A3P6SIF0_9BILA|nr:unnamed protein product [Gongylonema pulchrum]
MLNNLEYPTDLMAGQEAHAYKYADREQLFYQCQVSISVKEPNEACSRPQCAEPLGFGARKVEKAYGKQPTRRRRNTDVRDVVDVRAELSALDITDQVLFVFFCWIYTSVRMQI